MLISDGDACCGQVVQFDETMAVREVVFWRLMFEHLLLSCSGTEAVTAMFTRLVTNAAGPSPHPLTDVHLLSGATCLQTLTDALTCT